MTSGFARDDGIATITSSLAFDYAPLGVSKQDVITAFLAGFNRTLHTPLADTFTPDEVVAFQSLVEARQPAELSEAALLSYLKQYQGRYPSLYTHTKAAYTELTGKNIEPLLARLDCHFVTQSPMADEEEFWQVFNKVLPKLVDEGSTDYKILNIFKSIVKHIKDNIEEKLPAWRLKLLDNFYEVFFSKPCEEQEQAARYCLKACALRMQHHFSKYNNHWAKRLVEFFLPYIKELHLKMFPTHAKYKYLRMQLGVLTEEELNESQLSGWLFELAKASQDEHFNLGFRLFCKEVFYDFMEHHGLSSMGRNALNGIAGREKFILNAQWLIVLVAIGEERLYKKIMAQLSSATQQEFERLLKSLPLKEQTTFNALLPQLQSESFTASLSEGYQRISEQEANTSESVTVTYESLVDELTEGELLSAGNEADTADLSEEVETSSTPTDEEEVNFDLKTFARCLIELFERCSPEALDSYVDSIQRKEEQELIEAHPAHQLFYQGILEGLQGIRLGLMQEESEQELGAKGVLQAGINAVPSAGGVLSLVYTGLEAWTRCRDDTHQLKGLFCSQLATRWRIEDYVARKLVLLLSDYIAALALESAKRADGALILRAAMLSFVDAMVQSLLQGAQELDSLPNNSTELAHRLLELYLNGAGAREVLATQDALGWSLLELPGLEKIKVGSLHRSEKWSNLENVRAFRQDVEQLAVKQGINERIPEEVSVPGPAGGHGSVTADTGSSSVPLAADVAHVYKTLGLQGEAIAAQDRKLKAMADGVVKLFALQQQKTNQLSQRVGAVEAEVVAAKSDAQAARAEAREAVDTSRQVLQLLQQLVPPQSTIQPQPASVQPPPSAPPKAGTPGAHADYVVGVRITSDTSASVAPLMAEVGDDAPGKSFTPQQ